MENPSIDPQSTWYVGHHDSKRGTPVTDQLLRQAQDANYDMLTSPITTTHFKSSVHNLISSYVQAVENAGTFKEIPLPLVPALKPIDSTLIPSDNISQLLAVSASWIDLASPDPVIANISRQVFNLEVAYAAFCGVQHVIVHAPILDGNTMLTQFSRALQEALSIGPYMQFHILLPIAAIRSKQVDDPKHLSQFARTVYSTFGIVSDWTSWDAWNVIRQFCTYSGRLSVALRLARQMPPLAVQSRWASEPIRLIVIPQSTFVLNKNGQPVFPKAHQALLYRYMKLRIAPWLMLSGVGHVPSAVGSPMQDSVVASDGGTDLSPWPLPAEASDARSSLATDPTPHLSYIRYLQRNQPPKPPIERFGAGYQDYLQAPLQPLADNLESITYEVFEKDPVKYEWYERAIAHALMDWTTEEKPTSSPSGAVVIAVVGSGRGPLVTRALRASQATDVAVEVWAVEKNPNAYVLLQRHNQLEWNNQVTVVKTDMRAWKGPVLPNGTHGHVDILVSELLGSYADNELSPECLDGAQHVLQPQHGLSIPASYTAHLTPISTPKLYADILGKSNADKDVFDLPYVVMLHQHDYLSTIVPKLSTEDPASSAASGITAAPIPNVQTCWQFSHPLPPAIIAQSSLRRGGSAVGGFGGSHGGDGANEHNSRSCTLTFPCANRGTCHGLGGYFETILYTSSDIDDSTNTPVTVELSTNPVTMDAKSKDMISWFPIFFPLRTPVGFPDQSEVKVSMWRCTDDRKVWYEWCVEAFVVMPNGERVRVGGGEVMSSRKNGCLM